MEGGGRRLCKGNIKQWRPQHIASHPVKNLCIFHQNYFYLFLLLLLLYTFSAAVAAVFYIWWNELSLCSNQSENQQFHPSPYVPINNSRGPLPPQRTVRRRLLFLRVICTDFLQLISYRVMRAPFFSTSFILLPFVHHRSFVCYYYFI